MLKLDKQSYKNIGIYNIGCIANKKIADCKNIYSVNPLYLRINHAGRYIEEKGVNKYLSFDPVDEYKELLKNAMMLLTQVETKSKKQIVMGAIMKKTI